MLFWLFVLGLIYLFIKNEETKKKYKKGCLIFFIVYLGLYLCVNLSSSSNGGTKSCARYEYVCTSSGHKYLDVICKYNGGENAIGQVCAKWEE